MFCDTCSIEIYSPAAQIYAYLFTGSKEELNKIVKSKRIAVPRLRDVTDVTSADEETEFDVDARVSLFFSLCTRVNV